MPFGRFAQVFRSKPQFGRIDHDDLPVPKPISHASRIGATCIDLDRSRAPALLLARYCGNRLRSPAEIELECPLRAFRRHQGHAQSMRR